MANVLNRATEAPHFASTLSEFVLDRRGTQHVDNIDIALACAVVLEFALLPGLDRPRIRLPVLVRA
jgi:hypothetical protein